MPGQRVSMEYEARLENGMVVDKSSSHIDKGDEYFTITVGMGEVIDGWDMGLMSMTLGEKCDLFIAAKYGFGEAGKPPKIPKGSPIIFRVELLQIGQTKCDRLTRFSRPDKTLLNEATMQKTAGNAEFKTKDYPNPEKI